MAHDESKYDLKPVTRRTALAALRRVQGESAGEASWAWACTEVGADEDAEQLPQRELLRIADKLASAGGLIGVVGSSMRINLSTNEALSPNSSGEASDE